MEKYPNIKILGKRNFDISKLNIKEIGEKTDLEKLDKWLESDQYNHARSREIISYINGNDPLENYLEGTKILKGHKNFYEIQECEENSHLVDRILNPQIEFVIFLKFFSKLLDELDAMKIEQKKKINIPLKGFAFEKIAKSIFNFLNNDDYELCLECDPYFSEKIIWRDILARKTVEFSKWKFSNYEGPEKEIKEKFITNKGITNLRLGISETAQENFIEKRKSFRRLAMLRMDRIINEIRKLQNLSTRTNYQYNQTEISELLDGLIEKINLTFERFRPMGLENPLQIEKVKPPEYEKKIINKQINNPEGTDLEVELKTLKQSMQEKFAELEFRINLSKEEKND